MCFNMAKTMIDQSTDIVLELDLNACIAKHVVGLG